MPLKKQPPYSCILWNKLTCDQIDLYQKKMDEKLSDIDVSFETLFHGDKMCCNTDHNSAIETYYRKIVDAVMYAETFLPKTKPSLQRPFWTEALSHLKSKSIECVQNWKNHGMPRDGPLFACKRSCTLKYKSISS